MENKRISANYSHGIIIAAQSASSTPVSLVGLKAVGLSALPAKWVPKYFIVNSFIGNRWYWNYLKNGSNPVKCQDFLSEIEIKSIEEALLNLSIPINGRVIVRSSFLNEGIELRGALKSEVTDAKTVNILSSFDSIFLHASSKLDTSSHDLNLALIVQIYTEPKETGHLSNERRVARRIQEWVYEFDNKEIPLIGRFAIKFGFKKTASADPDKILTATNKEGLIKQLRTVAAFVNNKKLRLHLEWAWDEQTLWLVQADKDQIIRGKDPKIYSLNIKTKLVSKRVSLFTPFSEVEHGQWSKLRQLSDFKNAGLPYARLWVLDNPSIIQILQTDNISDDFKLDMQTLVSSPIVIRMDVKQNDKVSEYLLPRSDCINDPEKLREFLVSQSRFMFSKGLSSGDFCFILHHYIPSRSAAFCLAYPNRQKVRIDSIWGLPDGLLFYSHDSFELNPNDLASLKKCIRFKDNYLAPAYSGEWLPVVAGKPWDWKPSITKEELIFLGIESQKLAKYINDCVQIMWFIDIPTESGLPKILPWWYEKGLPPLNADTADPRIFNRNRIVISTRDDLEKISTSQGNPPEDTILRLSPKPELLRNTDFLESVAEKANKYYLPVELQGSILTHAFYQLKKLGVRVQCVDFFSPTFSSQYFDKLVRDKIPLRIKRGGESAYTIAVSGDDLIKLLKTKAVEESLELKSSSGVANTEEELGDILEVIFSIAEQMGISVDKLYQKMEHKRKERGGFREGLVLLETKETPLIDIESPSYRLSKRGERVDLLIPNTKDKVIITTRRIPQYINDRLNQRIEIPLVPPDIRDTSLKIDELKLTFKIRYEDKVIILKWVSYDRPKISPGQLPLSL